jgi:hypothetical protein
VPATWPAAPQRPTHGSCAVVLTVTDTVGQSDSEMLPMAFVDQTPD